MCLCTRMASVLMLSMPFMFQHMTMKKEYLQRQHGLVQARGLA